MRPHLSIKMVQLAQSTKRSMVVWRDSISWARLRAVYMAKTFRDTNFLGFMTVGEKKRILLSLRKKCSS